MDEYEFMSDEEVEFQWDEFYDTVVVENFSLTDEEIIKVVLLDKTIETISWRGTVIRRNYYSTDDTKEVSEPAYGGYSNTNGIPEMGVISVDRSLLRNSKII